jgi:phosphoribosyl 1,2-cyclic phosphodiesterase
LRFGGNTSCVEVSLQDGSHLILDAGTGIRELGLHLAQSAVTTFHLCLTHLHLDHLEGLAFFAPVWRRETEVHVWGPASPLRTLEQRIARWFSPPLFPITLAEVPSRIVFHDVPPAPWEIDGLQIDAQPVWHAGPTVGYRVEGDGAALAYIPDHEPALAVDLPDRAPEWISGFSLAAGADVLIHDCQYTDEEYATRLGFGHSSTSHVAAFATRTEVERLVMFHHDPLHTDADLDRMHADVVEGWGVEPDRCLTAAEGAALDV